MKKALAILFSLVMLVSMASPALADSKQNIITNITNLAFYNYERNAAINPEQTAVDDEIIIPLVKEGFEDETGAYIVWNDNTPDLGPTAPQLRNNKVTAEIVLTKGRELIRDISIVKYTPTKRVRAQAAVRIRFVEDFVSTQEMEYEIAVVLLLDKKRSAQSETFGGRMANQYVDVRKDDVYVNIGDGTIINCLESVDNIKVDIGAGFTMQTSLIGGEKYYGRVRYEPNNSQDAVLEAYKDIEGMYIVRTINLQTRGNVMTLDLPDGVSYYVYNQFGEYLGRSDDAMPYSTKYYFATSKIDIDPELTKFVYEVQQEDVGPALERFHAGIIGQPAA